MYTEKLKIPPLLYRKLKIREFFVIMYRALSFKVAGAQTNDNTLKTEKKNYCPNKTYFATFALENNIDWQCCGSRMFIPDPRSKRYRNPDPDPQH
jgi:hypothetical protein